MLERKTANVEVDVGGAATPVMIPTEMLVRLRVKSGDELFLVETPDGLLLSPRSPEVARQIRFGREGMEEFRETFKRLAQ